MLQVFRLEALDRVGLRVDVALERVGRNGYHRTDDELAMMRSRNGLIQQGQQGLLGKEEMGEQGMPAADPTGRRELLGHGLELHRHREDPTVPRRLHLVEWQAQGSEISLRHIEDATGKVSRTQTSRPEPPVEYDPVEAAGYFPVEPATNPERVVLVVGHGPAGSKEPPIVREHLLDLRRVCEDDRLICDGPVDHLLAGGRLLVSPN